MYKIVIDSCGELPEELKQDGHYEKSERESERTKVLLPVTGAVYGCI